MMLLGIVIFILLVHLFEGSISLRIVGIVALAGFYLGAAMIILKASHKISETELNRAWIFVSIGLVLWTIAYLVENTFPLISSQQLPIPSIADLVRYAGLLGIVVGFGVYPETRERIFGRIRALLDISILSVGAIIVFWMVFLRSMLSSGLADLITTLWIEARVGFDLIWIILLLRLFLKAEDRNERGAFLFFGL